MEKMSQLLVGVLLQVVFQKASLWLIKQGFFNKIWVAKHGLWAIYQMLTSKRNYLSLTLSCNNLDHQNGLLVRVLNPVSTYWVTIFSLTY